MMQISSSTNFKQFSKEYRQGISNQYYGQNQYPMPEMKSIISQKYIFQKSISRKGLSFSIFNILQGPNDSSADVENDLKKKHQVQIKNCQDSTETVKNRENVAYNFLSSSLEFSLSGLDVIQIEKPNFYRDTSEVIENDKVDRNDTLYKNTFKTLTNIEYSSFSTTFEPLPFTNPHLLQENENYFEKENYNSKNASCKVPENNFKKGEITDPGYSSLILRSSITLPSCQLPQININGNTVLLEIKPNEESDNQKPFKASGNPVNYSEITSTKNLMSDLENFKQSNTLYSLIKKFKEESIKNINEIKKSERKEFTKHSEDHLDPLIGPVLGPTQIKQNLSGIKKNTSSQRRRSSRSVLKNKKNNKKGSHHMKRFQYAVNPYYQSYSNVMDMGLSTHQYLKQRHNDLAFSHSLPFSLNKNKLQNEIIYQNPYQMHSDMMFRHDPFFMYSILNNENVNNFMERQPENLEFSEEKVKNNSKQHLFSDQPALKENINIFLRHGNNKNENKKPKSLENNNPCPDKVLQDNNQNKPVAEEPLLQYAIGEAGDAFEYKLNNSDQGTSVKKRQKRSFSREQKKILEDVFQHLQHPSRYQIENLCAELNVKENQIKWWFNNRRAKYKRQSANL